MATSTTSSGGFLGFGAYKTQTITDANQNTGSSTPEGMAAIRAKADAARAAAFKDPLSDTTGSATPFGTSTVSTASTQAKIETLHASGKTGAAQAAEKLFQTNASVPVSQAVNDFDKTTQQIIKSLFAVELKLHRDITTASNSAATGIGQLTAGVKAQFEIAKDDMNEALKPVSSATGSVLATMTGVLRDPLGSIDTLGKALAHQVDKTNPGFMDKLEATMKKYKVDEIQHLPSTIMGGLRSLASTVDALLSVPLAIAADIYNGLMEIMQEISQLLDSVVSGIMDLIFGPKGLLDSLLPMGEIMDFLEAVGEVADFVGGITGAFSGLSAVTNIASQVSSFSSMGMGALGNPAALAMSFLPPGVSQYTSGLRNPDGMISQLLPASVQQQLGKISSLPGLGFVGNMGYSIGGSLNSLKGGIAENILNQYTSQIGILGPLLGKPSKNSPYTNQAAARSPMVIGSSTNPDLAVADPHQTRVYLQDRPLVLPQKNSSNPLQAAVASPVAALNTPSAPFKYNAIPSPSTDTSYIRT
jgi:hypothetical protein